MGGLIYRELYIGRKFYITNILVVLLFILMCSLVRLSMICGNLAHLDKEIFEFIDPITYYAFTYLVAYVAFSIMDDPGVILSDYRSNWRIFAYSLPVTPVKRVLVKYIIKLGAFCIAMILSIINGYIIAAFTGRTFGTEQILNFFLLVNFWLIVDILRTPMMLRAKSEKGFQMSGTAGYFIVMAAIMFPLLGKVTMIVAEISIAAESNDISDDDSMFMLQQRMGEFLSNLHNKVLVWMPLLTAAILIVGFIICVLVLKRRES